MAQLLTTPLPLVLVVKAPNQKIDDQRIECTGDWTVNQLKRHLSQVYPTNPTESQQRIIYSGQLLQDSLQLKDVLKQYEPDQNVHTIHLVCSASMSQCPSPSSTPLSGPDLSSDGLRRRFPEGGAPQESDPAEAATRAFSNMDYPSYVPHPGMMYYYGGSTMNGAAGMVPPMMPATVPGYMPYGAEQMHWMQQAYAQSMMQYMQQYQQQVASQPHLMMPQMAPGIPAQPVNQNFPNEFPGVAPPGGGGAAAAGVGAIDPDVPIQPIGMNAHGGRDVDDDGERANRDWLDTTYTLVRFVMLMSILYFYSTPQRFLAAFIFATMFYVYRVGFLRRAAPVGNPAPVDAPVNREEPPPEGLRQEDEGDSEPEVTMVNLQATHRPSTFALVWSVVTSFFSSLIPENPIPINNIN